MAVPAGDPSPQDPHPRHDQRPSSSGEKELHPQKGDSPPAEAHQGRQSEDSRQEIQAAAARV